MSDTDFPFPFDPEDPRVTAYALDEMHDAGTRAGFEQLLARSPEARAMVEEIRALSGQLIAEYDEERLLAQAEPSNVIRLPAAPRRAWVQQLLRMAAALAVLGVAGALLAPYFRGAQAVKLHPEGEMTQSLEAPAAAAAPPAADGLRAPTAVARSGVASQMAIPYGAVIAAAKPAKPFAATDAKDENAMPAAPRAGEDADVLLKPSLERPAAAVAGNALGGGAGGIAADSPVKAKEAFFQNRSLGRGGNGGGGGADSSASRVFAQSSLGSLKRLAPASRTRFIGTVASPGEAGFVSPSEAPVSSFEIAWNSDPREKTLANASEARQMARAPAVAGKTLNDFPFNGAPPPPGDPHAIAIQSESASCPWAPGHRLVRIGFQGRAGASDVRQVQVKFDPAQVAAYRLVGGVPRSIQLNAWQEATVLYEVIPAEAPQDEEKAKELDRLPVDRPVAHATSLLTVTVQPAALKAGVSGEEYPPVEFPATPGDIFSASADFKFSAAVAAYQLGHLDLAIQLAQEGLGPDPGGDRAVFLDALRKQAQGDAERRAP